MRCVLPAALLFLATPALAQQPPQPSQRALIAILHQELQQTEDSLTLAQARIVDLQQRLAAAQVAASSCKPNTKGH